MRRSSWVLLILFFSNSPAWTSVAYALSIDSFVTPFIIFQESTESVMMWPGYRTMWMRCVSSAALIICMCVILYLYSNADVNTVPPRVGSVIISRYVASCISNALAYTVEEKKDILSDINTIAADVLAPCVARLSSAMVFIMLTMLDAYSCLL